MRCWRPRHFSLSTHRALENEQWLGLDVQRPPRPSGRAVHSSVSPPGRRNPPALRLSPESEEVASALHEFKLVRWTPKLTSGDRTGTISYRSEPVNRPSRIEPHHLGLLGSFDLEHARVQPPSPSSRTDEAVESHWRLCKSVHGSKCRTISGGTLTGSFDVSLAWDGLLANRLIPLDDRCGT